MSYIFSSSFCFQQHSDNCDYAVYPCPHVEYGCQFKEIKAKFLMHHISKCEFHPETEADCCYGCGVKVKVKNVIYYSFF